MRSSEPRSARRTRTVTATAPPAIKTSGLGRTVLLAHAAEAASEVVEDEADRRLCTRGGGNPALALAHEEHASGPQLRLHLRHAAGFGRADATRLVEQLRPQPGQLAGAFLVLERRAFHGALLVEDHRDLDLRRDLRQLGKGLRRVHRARL